MSDRLVLAVFTDGRGDLLERTLASFDRHVTLPDGGCSRLIFDDSGKRRYADWLDEEFGGDYQVIHAPVRRGFGGTIRNAWNVLTEFGDSWGEWVFHLEDDFEFQRDVPIPTIIEVLRQRPWLVQVALRRQPWGAAELAAGGYVQQHPDDYQDCAEGALRWLTHRRFFTTNPSVYRRELCATGWPEGDESEGHFTHALLADSPLVRFGIWGERTDDPWILHTGRARAGSGY